MAEHFEATISSINYHINKLSGLIILIIGQHQKADKKSPGFNHESLRIINLTKYETGTI
jgi:hypothetical protein